MPYNDELESDYYMTAVLDPCLEQEHALMQPDAYHEFQDTPIDNQYNTMQDNFSNLSIDNNSLDDFDKQNSLDLYEQQNLGADSLYHDEYSQNLYRDTNKDLYNDGGDIYQDNLSHEKTDDYSNPGNLGYDESYGGSPYSNVRTVKTRSMTNSVPKKKFTSSLGFSALKKKLGGGSGK